VFEASTVGVNGQLLMTVTTPCSVRLTYRHTLTHRQSEIEKQTDRHIEIDIQMDTQRDRHTVSVNG